MISLSSRSLPGSQTISSQSPLLDPVQCWPSSGFVSSPLQFLLYSLFWSALTHSPGFNFHLYTGNSQLYVSGFDFSPAPDLQIWVTTQCLPQGAHHLQLLPNVPYLLWWLLSLCFPCLEFGSHPPWVSQTANQDIKHHNAYLMAVIMLDLGNTEMKKIFSNFHCKERGSKQKMTKTGW